MKNQMTTKSTLTVEETLYVATILDNSNFKTRLAVIQNMELALSGNIITREEKHFINVCILKLQSMSEQDFNNINYLSAWTLDAADEQESEQY